MHLDKISKTKTNTVRFRLHVESNKTQWNIKQNQTETDFRYTEQADSCQRGGGGNDGEEHE